MKFLHQIEQPRVRYLLVLPLVMWIVLYASAPWIFAHTENIRPTIDVRSLYNFDTWLLYYLPSTYLAALHNDFFDILGAIAYTLHSVWPVAFLVYMVLFRRRDLILPYVNCFGTVCFLGLITQLVMPTAPPWYYYNYKFEPADYSLKGDPAGLKRVDELFNIQFYKNMFDSSPVVFGSFPSLHVGWPTLTALMVYFDTSLHKSIKIAACCYVVYVGIAVMYLQHHYFVDVFGGIFYSFVVYKFFGLKSRPTTSPPIIKLPCCSV